MLRNIQELFFRQDLKCGLVWSDLKLKLSLHPQHLLFFCEQTKNNLAHFFLILVLLSTIRLPLLSFHVLLSHIFQAINLTSSTKRSLFCPLHVKFSAYFIFGPLQLCNIFYLFICLFIYLFIQSFIYSFIICPTPIPNGK